MGKVANMCYFSANRIRRRGLHTQWANGLAESQTKHLGRFTCTISQQKNGHWFGHFDFQTFAQNTKKVSEATPPAHKMLLEGNPRPHISQTEK